MEENTLACVGSVMLLLVKNDTLCNWFLKKKKRERKRLPALQGLTAPSYDQVPNPFLLNLRPSFHEFIPHVISNWKNKNRVFFSSVSKKKKKGELWFFANSWRETICFNGAGSVIFTLTKGRFSALRDPRNRSCCCSSDVLMGFTGLWHWGHSLNHPVPSRCLP